MHHPPPPTAVSDGITLMIDNYDSFTYNIVQYLSQLGAKVVVYRNDELSVSDAVALNPVNVVISPGPGTPADAGSSKAIIEAFAGRVPVLGVCLGHQSIIELYGGQIVRCQRIMHGKVSPVYHDEKGVYTGLNEISTFNSHHARYEADPTTYNQETEQPFKTAFLATRYHSLVGNPDTLPKELMVTAYTEELPLTRNDPNANDSHSHNHNNSTPHLHKTIMGVRHREYTVEGVQFHPESVTTEYGMDMLKNFLKLRGGKWAEAQLV